MYGEEINVFYHSNAFIAIVYFIPNPLETPIQTFKMSAHP